MASQPTAKPSNASRYLFLILIGLVIGAVATVMAMLGLEVNVVLAKRLYPRALLTPFTDAVQLTEADRRVYREYAQAQRHKGFEQVRVSFGDDPDVSPPGDRSPGESVPPEDGHGRGSE